MKFQKFFMCLIFSISHYYAISQTLLKQWDFRFGGNEREMLEEIIPISSGGYLLCGYSYSDINGNKTEPLISYADYWIVKVDSVGNKVWDKDYGASNGSGLSTAIETNDKGFLLVGYSRGGIGGVKTQPNWDTTEQTVDFWIIKINEDGQVLWDKSYGGSNDDIPKTVFRTSDHGYIIGGYSASGISGNKTQGNWGQNDYWVVKVDSMGNKLWDKDFGGIFDDQLNSIIEINDKSILLGGSSNSPVSGNKTQALWGPLGATDYWLIKIDSSGNFVWDKEYGGAQSDLLSSMISTSDQNIILGGSSASDISGNKTESTKDTIANGGDYWIIKTDTSGNMIWNVDIGGKDADQLTSISLTQDHGLLLCGVSYSNQGANKSENNLGLAQSWVVKLDSVGIKQWDKTLLVNSVYPYDQIGLGQEAGSGCYILGNYTSAGVGGEKSQANWDTTNLTWDYWIAKYCDSILQGSTELISVDNINVWPSPAFDFLYLTSDKDIISIKILNSIGNLVLELQNSFQKIAISNLRQGIYFLQVMTKNENFMIKFVKN